MKRQLILSAIVAAGLGAAGLGQMVREPPASAQGGTPRSS